MQLRLVCASDLERPDRNDLGYVQGWRLDMHFGSESSEDVPDGREGNHSPNPEGPAEAGEERGVGSI